MTQQIERKDQHFKLASQQYQVQPDSDLARLRFVHHALPEMAAEEADSSTTLAGLAFSSPFFINAITGGSQLTTQINQRLAALARETGLAMATGSVSIAMKDPQAAESFKIIRRENPRGLVFANLGAHHGLESAKRAVALLEADALQVHVNAPQEVIMPEGDRSFAGWLNNIEQIASSLEVPVIVKEVGFGMSRETIAQLAGLGLAAIDISGRGGTNFARIENARRKAAQYDFLEDWGQTTVESLIEAGSLPRTQRPQIIASGGVQTALDIVKCLALGADLVGLSGQVLQWIRQPNSLEAAVQAVRDVQLQITDIMTLLGARTVADLRWTDVLLPVSVQNWAVARGLDISDYARRSSRRSTMPGQT